jgi:hypothetical protein
MTRIAAARRANMRASRVAAGNRRRGRESFLGVAVGANPWLQGDPAAAAIREGRLTEVSIAVQALVDDSWSG